jgi:hypothetical protein
VAGYTKLFSTILASTIWRADDKVRIVWITLLAMADRFGIAEGSVPGLADFARVSIEDCDRALQALMSVDARSRTKTKGGRRIEVVDGGWKVINHAKYRNAMGADERREYKRKKQAEYRRKAGKRARGQKRGQTWTAVDNGGQSGHIAEAEAEADTYTKEVRTDARRASENQVRTEERDEPRFVPPTVSPHGTPTNLVNGYANRAHGQHAWCSLPRDGLCVPYYLHREFLGKSLKPEDELKAWYRATIERFADTPIGDDPFVFWRNEFAEWCGLVTARPVKKAMSLSEQLAARARK